MNFTSSFYYKRIEKKVRPYTLVSPERIRCLYDLARRVESYRIPGDIVECGVCNGGTAAILAHVASNSKFERTIWLFDSFEGMPETSKEDGEIAGQYAGKVVGSIEKVHSVLKKVGSNMNRIRIVKGWFTDTFPTVNIPEIALLNIDSDWYQSVHLCLETFFGAVVPEGYVSIDDYGHWPGCKQAVDEFFRSKNLIYRLNKVDYTARWFQKL